MKKLIQYIKSTFNKVVDLDASQYSQNAKLKLLTKASYSIYITPINIARFKYNENRYFEMIKRACAEWSAALTEKKITFYIVNSLNKSDIVIYWGKASYSAAGMQWYEKTGNFKRLALTIGLFSKNDDYSHEEVYALILHEFGHILGLGHSENKNDIMFPKWNPNISELSDNDKLILNLIYYLGDGRTYTECKRQIEDFIQCYNKIPSNTHISDKNLLDSLSEIASINKDKLQLQNITIDTLKRKYE